MLPLELLSLAMRDSITGILSFDIESARDAFGETAVWRPGRLRQCRCFVVVREIHYDRNLTVLS